MNSQSHELLLRCISVDLEVNPASAEIFALAAVHADGRSAVVLRRPPIESELDRLQQSLTGVEHVVGHNILRHDLPHLLAKRPQMAAVFTAPIDTLWLNPLAFPRNPYHHLVKHYHDGRLEAGHINDPELDARLVFDVLDNQLEALGQQHSRQPEALAAYHYLTTRMDGARGFDAVFREVRGSEAPDQVDARLALTRLLRGRCCLHSLKQLLVGLENPQLGWPTAYALSWILVAGGDSVMPPWVCKQFPDASHRQAIARHELRAARLRVVP